jgi:hypothetical protein
MICKYFNCQENGEYPVEKGVLRLRLCYDHATVVKKIIKSGDQKCLEVLMEVER